MRFISRSPGYKFAGKKQEFEILASGQYRETVPGFICEFTVWETNEYDQELARQSFKFNGTTTTPGGVPIDPIWRVSSYDTDTDPRLQNDPELKAKVEERLLRWQCPENHILVEPQKLPEPWTGYDRLTAQGRRTNAMIAEKVAARVQEDGYSKEEIDRVLAYERATLNRAEVIEALQAVLVPDDLVAA